MSSLDIAMIGTRGLPASFGGVEHHVEQIGTRLAARGHRVTVYSEKGYGAERTQDHQGMRIVPVAAVHRRSLEAITHATLSTMAAMRERPDVLHYHAVGPGLVTPVPRALSGSAVVQTVHGLDADRAKWGPAERRLLRYATWQSARVPHSTITVSAALREHYDERYHRACTAIPNGITARTDRPPLEIIERFGLERHRYVLFVGRLVPEKRPELLVEAFRALDSDVRLVVVGGSSFTDKYVDAIGAAAARDDRVLLPGYVYGDALDELFSNAAVFVQPSDLEGLPLTLLEALGSRLPVLVSDIAPHLDIVTSDRPGSRVFAAGDGDDLGRRLAAMLDDLSGERRGAAEVATAALEVYDWDHCTDQVEQVYREAVARSRRGRRAARATGDARTS